MEKTNHNKSDNILYSDSPLIQKPKTNKISILKSINQSDRKTQRIDQELNHFTSVNSKSQKKLKHTRLFKEKRSTKSIKLYEHLSHSQNEEISSARFQDAHFQSDNSDNQSIHKTPRFSLTTKSCGSKIEPKANLQTYRYTKNIHKKPILKQKAYQFKRQGAKQLKFNETPKSIKYKVNTFVENHKLIKPITKLYPK